MKKLFFALPFLLAGCQSERVAFQFQPVAPTGSVAPASRPVALAPAAATAPTTDARAEAASGQRQPTTRLLAKKHKLFKNTGSQPNTTNVAVPTAADVLPATVGASQPYSLRSLALRRLVRQRATAGPARTAESGLGGIALFFIAVVLGLVAGLGALVSLIFGTGFFTGVGFAAAGLVVLFLLYSLLSGGKHKKPATPSK